MRTLKLTVAYDGTRYAGWQIQQRRSQRSEVRGQKGHGSQRRNTATIQGTLERVLGRILQEPVKAVGSGRTDAGVHALAQVAHVRTQSALSCERLLRSLNRLLPPEIAVTRVEEANDAFHARFHALRKRYRYRMFTGAVVPPFIRPYVHHVRAPLGISSMRRELACLVGRHDFRAFARASGTRRSAKRAISVASLTRRGDELHLELEGNGFLHTMVRSIAGTLIDVGRGHRPPGTVHRLLRSKDRTLAGPTAPARGLALVSVAYHREIPLRGMF